MNGDGFQQAVGMLNVMISLANALKTLLNMGKHVPRTHGRRHMCTLCLRVSPCIRCCSLATAAPVPFWVSTVQLLMLAHAGSVGFHRTLMDIQNNAGRDAIRAALIRGRNWCSIIERLERIHATGRSLTHPKILKLVEVLRDHFMRFQASSTRCIVFTHARATVDEILGHLKALEPMCLVSHVGRVCVCVCLRDFAASLPPRCKKRRVIAFSSCVGTSMRYICAGEPVRGSGRAEGRAACQCQC